MEKYSIISGPYSVGDFVTDNKTNKSGIVSKVTTEVLRVVFDGETVEYDVDGFPLDNEYGVLLKQTTDLKRR